MPERCFPVSEGVRRRWQLTGAAVVGGGGRGFRRSVCLGPRSHGSAPAAAGGMQRGLQREAVLQSGGEWVIVAFELKPRTGVVRLLPPHHSGPTLFRLSRLERKSPQWRSGVSTSTASIPRTASPFLLAFELPSLTASFSPRA